MSLRLAVLTTGRQDWGILRSACLLLRDDSAFDLKLLVGGMHNVAEYGLTRRLIEEEGFAPSEVLDWLGGSVEPSACDQAGRATALVGEALVRQGAAALLLVGDRFETAAAALAATLTRVPLVHLHGGEETEAVIDNALRHAITKLSHLHLVAHAVYRERVISLGEDPDTVHVVGAPGLDNLQRDDLAAREELEALLGIPLRPPLVVVTLHPATLAVDPQLEVQAVCAAMDQVSATYVITLPNADPGQHEVRAALREAGGRRGRVAVEALGERRYWGLLRLCDAMLGNSSSGLIEAPSLRLPAVNVGDRQKGRLRTRSVLDVPPEAATVAEALRHALDPSFRTSLTTDDALGDGHAAEKIRRILADWRPPQPPVKRTRWVC